jgi:hypothetical protein
MTDDERARLIDDDQGPPDVFRWIFVAIGLVVALGAESLSLLKFIAARRISQRRARTFCICVAAITCISIPYRTALG